LPGVGLRYSPRLRRAVYWLSVAAVAVITFVLLAEFEFFREFQTRYNQLAFQYLDQPKIVGGMIWYNYPVVRYVLVWAAWIIILGAVVRRLMRWSYDGRHWQVGRREGRQNLDLGDARMKPGMHWFGRSGRLVIGGLLVFSTMAQPSIVGAQAAPGPLGPPNLGGTTLPTASDAILRGQDPYPRAATPVNVVRGGQTISVRPLQTTLLASGKEALQSRLLVSFTRTINDADLSDISAKAARLGAGAAHPLVRIGTREFMVDVAGAASIEAAAKAFATADARVQGASPDYVIQAAETPNDPDFNKQWGPQKIQAPAAWNRTHGSSSKVIAILDPLSGWNDDERPYEMRWYASDEQIALSGVAPPGVPFPVIGHNGSVAIGWSGSAEIAGARALDQAWAMITARNLAAVQEALRMGQIPGVAMAGSSRGEAGAVHAKGRPLSRGDRASPCPIGPAGRIVRGD